ncbi:DAK2 domain-containing protein [Corynebacterium kutscheri]|uniref:Dihydroxyacetone kinase 2 n=1 Tax=Corynebacterium kutscheri TaxID=35755 RepID=A0AB38VT56_9CORY|nr:DAK2 domain-containing protein [Corynebacterium kutscheri]VEH06963.1 Dihydroxyacetone kinase 2 [Corynebacterium kutscheri]
MTKPETLGGRGLLSWAHRAVASLEQRRSEINALNVFPVPDADTGSNMAHTMSAALKQAEQLIEAEPERIDDAPAIATALAVGSVRGARGNSGVVVSQVLRGVAQAAHTGAVDGRCIEQALGNALVFVHRAISDPVEGTVITVLRAASIAAHQASDRSLYGVVKEATDAAVIALANTPSHLAVLRKAGVVDAGGQGFVVILEALLAEVSGQPHNQSTTVAINTMVDAASIFEAQEDIAYETTQPGQSHGHQGYLEVMYFIETPDLEAHRAGLAKLGDSIQLAAISETSATVHIHTFYAAKVIERAFAEGTVSNLHIEVLPSVETSARTVRRSVVAVTPPGAIATLYRNAGARVVTRASEVEDIVQSLASEAHASGAQEIILLPNGMADKTELASIELASHAFEQDLFILPTVQLVRGLAALAVHDPSQPLGVDTYAMAEAVAAMRTVIIKTADKARLTQAGPCAKGDFLGISGTDTVAVAEDVLNCVIISARRLLESGGEQLTLLVDTELFTDITVAAISAGLPPSRKIEVMIYPAENLGCSVELGVG